MIDSSPPDWGDEKLGLPLVSIRPVTSSGNTILNFSELGMVSLELGTITSARKLLTNRSYGVSYHLCSG